MNPAPIIRLLDLSGLTRFEHEAMATRFQLHLLPPPDGSPLRPIAEEAFRLLDRIEERLSFYQEGSDVTRINRAADGEVIRIDEITHGCLLAALEVANASEGAFDPFAGFASLKAKAQETPHHLTGLEEPIAGDDKPVLALDPEQPMVTKLDGRRWLDLGAIGKGAALDAMAKLLQEWDVPTAVLDGGGSSILVYGASPTEAQPEWRLTLPQSPGSPEFTLPAPFALGASGDGFQPGHITDQQQRVPRPQSLVLAPSATLADAVSTASIFLTNAALIALVGDTPGWGILASHIEAPAVSAGIFQQSHLPPSPEVALIIPCWCESQRLPAFLRELADQITDLNLPVEVIVVDDGSPTKEARATAKEVDTLHKLFPQIRPMESVDHHRGKGGAVYTGWESATSSVRWLGFVDADGAVPPAAVVTGIQIALDQHSDLPIIAANRYHRDSELPVHRSWIRQRTGSWFASWARRQLKLDVIDSQCGFKLIPAVWWRERQRRDLQDEGYAFDMELLLAAKADNLPVKNLNISWREIGGSNVSWRDGLQLVRTVKRLREPESE